MRAQKEHYSTTSRFQRYSANYIYILYLYFLQLFPIKPMRSNCECLNDALCIGIVVSVTCCKEWENYNNWSWYAYQSIRLLNYLYGNMSFTSSRDLINGGGGQSLLNFRQKFQISDNTSHLYSKRLLWALLQHLQWRSVRGGEGGSV